MIRPHIVTISAEVTHDQVAAHVDCPVCGATGHRERQVVIQTDPEVTLLKCPRCKAVSASHIPTTEYLAEYYQDTFSTFYGLYNEGEEHDITFTDPQRFVRHLCRTIDFTEFRGRESLRIIDFGGGDGTLGLHIARQLPSECVVEVAVIDYGDHVVASDHQISVRKLNDLEEVSEPACIVLASASLEHVGHADAVIRKLVTLVEPGGYFYARTPYIVPLKRFVKSIDVGYPAHIHDMGADFWNSFPHTFDRDLELIRSRPSIVQITFAVSPLRWLTAHVMKFPAIVECLLFPTKPWLLWPFVGGWEATFRRKPATGQP